MRAIWFVLATMSGIAFAGDLIRIDDSAVKESFCTWHPSDVLCEDDPVDPPVDPNEPIDPPVDPNEPIDPPIDPCIENPESDGCPCPDADGSVYPDCPVDPPIDPNDPPDGLRPPNAIADDYGIAWDSPANNVLDNDKQYGDYPVTAHPYRQPKNGTVEVNLDGTFEYIPNSGFIGSDEFKYEIRNQWITGNSAYVFVTVTDGQTDPCDVDPTSNGCPCPEDYEGVTYPDCTAPVPPVDPGDPNEPYPPLAMTYQPDFPPLGQYSVPDVCVPHIDESWDQVTYRSAGHETESLQDAVDRLDSTHEHIAGIVNIPWDATIASCDTLRTRRDHEYERYILRGVVGPNGEQPRLYCRAEKRGGNVPDALAQGYPIELRTSTLLVVENIHIDGYKGGMTGFIEGHTVLRNNYVHHVLGDAIKNGDTAPGKVLNHEECGNEYSHNGQDNAKHTHYMGRGTYAKDDDGNRLINGPRGFANNTFVDNFMYSGPYSSLLKTNADNIVIKNNRFDTWHDSDPTFAQAGSGMLIDISSCTNALIEGNVITGYNGPIVNGHTDLIGIRHKRTTTNGCDIPHPYSEQFWDADYWNGLKAQGSPKLFVTEIRHNEFYARPDHTLSGDDLGWKIWPLAGNGGTWPIDDIYGGFKMPVLLEVPEQWYERHEIRIHNNTYVGFADSSNEGVNGTHLYKIDQQLSQPTYEDPPPAMPYNWYLLDRDFIVPGTGEVQIPGEYGER